jgi:hypothetical protein
MPRKPSARYAYKEWRPGPSTSARISVDMGRRGDQELFQAQIGKRVTKLRAVVYFNP